MTPAFALELKAIQNSASLSLAHWAYLERKKQY